VTLIYIYGGSYLWVPSVIEAPNLRNIFRKELTIQLSDALQESRLLIFFFLSSTSLITAYDMLVQTRSNEFILD